MPDARPVWLTREQRDWLARLQFAMYHEDEANAHRASILDAWDAAPADAPEAVRAALTTPGEAYPELVLGPILADALTPEVLRALGMPDA